MLRTGAGREAAIRSALAACSVLWVAGCSDSGSGGSPVAPAPIVNLVVDANRNGRLELEPGAEGAGPDELTEGTWTGALGAVFLVNLDDDDGDGIPDNADDSVNGASDELDLARIAVQAWPLAGDAAVGTLVFDEGSR
jgi:hypothetical protein